MQVKDEFVASVSHELRTPLTSVLGYLELLAENDRIPDDAVAHLRVVRRNAKRLQALLSDLLQVGEIGEMRLQLHRDDVDLVAVVREGAEAARLFADQAGIVVELDLPDSVVALVDEQRIRQVLDNLFSNAVKYSREGDTVTVCLRQVADGVVLEVTDTGMGIAPDEIDQVFGRFFRGGDALQQHIPGTGLGLNIVSSIVAAHGGEVKLASELGRGTTFRVTLPHVTD
jgi:signal transduction histidine kinase